MNINIFVIRAFFLLFLCSSAYSGKYPYPEMADSFSKEIIEILIAGGECKDFNDCYKKELIFRDGKENEIYIVIYKGGEIKKSSIVRISEKIIEKFYEMDRKISLELDCYIENREERHAFFSRAKPFISINLKGEK